MNTHINYLVQGLVVSTILCLTILIASHIAASANVIDGYYGASVAGFFIATLAYTPMIAAYIEYRDTGEQPMDITVRNFILLGMVAFTMIRNPARTYRITRNLALVTYRLSKFR